MWNQQEGAMTRYHISPETGRPSICRAKTPGACQFTENGQVPEHYDTRKEAQEDYEEKMKKHIVPHNEKQLSEVIDPELLNKMIREGYISTRAHPDDPHLHVMNYTKNTQHEGKWNDATKNARGLIIRTHNENLSDATIVERPWKKFFTLSQIRDENGNPGWALGDEEENSSSAPTELDRLDFTAPANVTDKMDGSMGVLYDAPDGRLAIATKGSFSSEQAIIYTQLLRDDPHLYAGAEKLREKHPDTTFVFELTGKDNPIVIPYDENTITLIGAINKSTGKYHTVGEFSETWGEENGLPTTETMPAKNLQEALNMPDRKNREGVVVLIQSESLGKQMQIKIKQEDYIKIHRIIHSMSNKTIAELASTGKYETIMSKVPEGLRKNQDAFYQKIMSTFQKRKEEVENKYAKLSHIEDQKDFALAVKKDSDASALFARRKGVKWKEILWKKILKNIDKIE